jgi:putative membrane protein
MTTRFGRLAALAVMFLATPLVLAQQAGDPPSWYWHHMWGGGWGFWWIFPVLMFFFVIALCVGALFMMFRGGGHASHHGMPWHQTGTGRTPWGDPTFSALQILNERLAKGEIQKQEYEEKKASILSSNQR